METKQMMELLLARMNASMKEHMQEMKADRKADKEDILAQISTSMKFNEDIARRLEAIIETNREKDQEDLKEMKDEIKAGQAEMRSTVCAMRSELEEIIQRELEAVIQSIWAELDESTTCNGATETEPDPGMMQSIRSIRKSPRKTPQ
jgi:hypothetical protein